MHDPPVTLDERPLLRGHPDDIAEIVLPNQQAITIEQRIIDQVLPVAHGAQGVKDNVLWDDKPQQVHGGHAVVGRASFLPASGNKMASGIADQKEGSD